MSQTTPLFLQAELARLTSLHFGTTSAHHSPCSAPVVPITNRILTETCTPQSLSISGIDDWVNRVSGPRWRPAEGLFKKKLTVTNTTNNNLSRGQQTDHKKTQSALSLAERYQLRTEDERSDRAKANVLAFERLYRRIFCAHHGSDYRSEQPVQPGSTSCHGVQNAVVNEQRAVQQAASSHGFAHLSLAPTRNEIEWAHDRQVDALHNRDNLEVSNGEIYRIVRYVCGPLTREALFEHIDRLIRSRYSMSYLFAYMKHLRRKYKKEFPLRGNERRAFTRSILQRYFSHYVPKRATDEIYSSDEQTYRLMRIWCWRYLFNDDCTINNTRNTRRPTLRFVYTFLLMYYTGKRLSELCPLNADHLDKLCTDRHIAIFIPKTRKLGRISYRTIDSHESTEFDAFLKRAVDLFRDNQRSPYRQSTVIPFDQFNQRKSLNRYFDRIYTQVTSEKKPRGLSFHSLRRRKAAISFERGVDLDNIREILDHSSSRVTNNYINKHLVRSYRCDQRSGDNGSTN